MVENNLVGIVDREHEIKDSISSLTHEDKMLLQLRKELYRSNWGKMKQDLNDRLKGRPYIHILARRIKDDLKRIEALKGIEKLYKINLLKYVSFE